MNKLPISLFFLFTVSISWSQAPIGTLDTKWTFEGWSEGSGWYPSWEGQCEGNKITFEVTDEIIIDGKNCGIINNNLDEENLIVYQEDNIVYFYENDEFYKLYDYNAQAGDTITSFRPSNAPSFSSEGGGFSFSQIDTIYTIINQLDTISIDGVDLRRWQTTPIYLYNEVTQEDIYNDFGTIIENIGSVNGITGLHVIFIAEGCQPIFVCYESNEFQLISPPFITCDFLDSVGELIESEIKIYPNPTNDVFQVEVEGISLNRIELFSLDGKKLFMTNETSIDLSNQPEGIYFISIINNDEGRVMKKVIKQ